MIKILKYLIIWLSIIILILVISFKIFDNMVLVERKIKLETIYNQLPTKFRNVSNSTREDIFLEINSYQKQQKFANTFLKSLVWYISSYKYEEVPYLIYGKTASVVLRGKNYSVKGKNHYALEISYYSMALMKLDVKKVIALYSYYGAVDNDGKFLYSS